MVFEATPGMPPSELLADNDGERLDVFVSRRLPGLSLVNRDLEGAEGGDEVGVQDLRDVLQERILWWSRGRRGGGS